MSVAAVPVRAYQQIRIVWQSIAKGTVRATAAGSRFWGVAGAEQALAVLDGLFRSQRAA
jgi:hypothetical protein